MTVTAAKLAADLAKKALDRAKGGGTIAGPSPTPSTPSISKAYEQMKGETTGRVSGGGSTNGGGAGRYPSTGSKVVGQDGIGTSGLTGGLSRRRSSSVAAKALGETTGNLIEQARQAYADKKNAEIAQSVPGGAAPAQTSSVQVSAPSVAGAPVSTTTSMATTTPVMGNYDAYDPLEYLRQAQENAQLAQQQATRAAVRQLRGQEQEIRDAADEAARQAYVSKMLQQRDLEQQLSASGYSGGMTDSAYLGLNTAYGNNRNDIMVGMNKSLNDLATEISRVKMEGDSKNADIAAQYAEKIAQMQMDLNAQAQANALAAAKASSSRSSSSSSSSGKPRLTASEVAKQLEAGNTSKALLEQAKWYGLVDDDGGDTGSGNGWDISNLTAGQRLTASQAIQLATREADPTAALYAMLMSGQIDQATYNNLRYSVMNPGR